MRTHVPKLLKVVILRFYNGHAPMVVPGMRTHVPKLLKAVISRCCGGRSQTVAHTIEISCAPMKR